MLVAGKFAWVPHVKLPVKYLWYSGKFACARRQCACVLREVLAASKQVNLPVITGKLHVTQVNCARDLFTCELHVKLPAFAGNFARASFTVYYIKVWSSKLLAIIWLGNVINAIYVHFWLSKIKNEILWNPIPEKYSQRWCSFGKTTTKV